MSTKTGTRKLRIESLEDRNLLSAGPVADSLPESLQDAIAHTDVSLAIAAEIRDAPEANVHEIPALNDYLSQVKYDHYMLHEHWGGTWSDAEKSPGTRDDSNLCWAAAASNVLEWTGWGQVAGIATTDQALDYIEQHWSNVLGRPYYAWRWWFDDVDVSMAQGEEVDGGGGFYPHKDVDDYVHQASVWERGREAMSTIDQYLHSGYGVTVSVIGGGLSHVVTCWGFSHHRNDPTEYTGIWITDSDDGKWTSGQPDQLRWYPVQLRDNRWHLQGYWGADHVSIDNVAGLEPRGDLARRAELAADPRYDWHRVRSDVAILWQRYPGAIKGERRDPVIAGGISGDVYATSLTPPGQSAPPRLDARTERTPLWQGSSCGTDQTQVKDGSLDADLNLTNRDYWFDILGSEEQPMGYYK